MKKLLIAALLLSSCHVVKYELALPMYSHKTHVTKRKHFTFPPDSLVRDWGYYEFKKAPVDITLDGYSIYRGDTMVHNAVKGAFMPDTTGEYWEYRWVDDVVNPCTGEIIKWNAE
jgi:hypothetical protein|tara:strand:- start:1722 stop:2066 length:345 start_codon:yes stop_codon:yes gene_type:complete